MQEDETVTRGVIGRAVGFASIILVLALLGGAAFVFYDYVREHGAKTWSERERSREQVEERYDNRHETPVSELAQALEHRSVSSTPSIASAAASSPDRAETCGLHFGEESRMSCRFDAVAHSMSWNGRGS
jgi:hypothetical protein